MSYNLLILGIRPSLGCVFGLVLCLVPPSYLNPQIPHQDIPDPPKPPPEHRVSMRPRAHSPSRATYTRAELRSRDLHACPHHRRTVSGTCRHVQPPAPVIARRRPCIYLYINDVTLINT